MTTAPSRTPMHNTIPVMPCLCSDYKLRESNDYVVEAKIDGVRAIVSVSGNKAKAWTRNGYALPLPFNAIVDIIDLCNRNKELGESIVFDCELTSDRLWLIDLPMLRSSYRVRRAALERLFSGIKESHYGCVRIVPIIHDPQKNDGYPEYISDLVTLACRDLYEGIVLKHPDSMYAQDSRAWYRVKPTKSLDLIVTAVRKNGSLVVMNGKRQVTVGIGLSDEMRLKARKGELIGKIIEVRFQEETASGSLRHPVFVRERNDKTEHN